MGMVDMQCIIIVFAEKCKDLFGDKLRDVRIFGSYARGDYDADSDVDVMILVDMDEVEARTYLGKVCDIACEIDLQHGIILSPLIRSTKDFDKRKVLPGFCQTVMREGVSVIAG